MNLNQIKQYLTTNEISFLIDFDKTININKSSKCKFHKMFKLQVESIRDFIMELDEDKIYMITPFISVNCRLNDPYLNLSRQFLISNNSNSNLIHDFLYSQLETFKNNFQLNHIN